MMRRLLTLFLVFILLGSNAATAQAQPGQLDTTSAEWVVQVPAAVPQARLGHTMTYDSRRGVIVLFGGFSYTGLLNDTLELVAGTWIKRTPASAPSERYGHVMTYDSLRNETVLFGGCGAPADTWTWDGTNWHPKQPTHNPGGQCHAAMAFDSQRGVAVLFGTDPSTGLAQTWQWNGTDWSLRPSDHTPLARPGDRMAYDADRGVIVLYGISNSSPETWEWDGADWTLKSTSGPPFRNWPSITYDTRVKRVVLFGGQWSSLYSDTWEWDGVTGTWSERVPASNPEPRQLSAMVFDEARGVSVLFGGSGDYGMLKDTWEWDSQLETWVNSVIPTAPPPAVAGPLAYDSRRQEVVLFGGGTTPGSGIGDTWTYGADGRWVRRRPDHSPAARSAHDLAYDSRRGVTVLFGGVQNRQAGPWTGFTDTWEWDGVDWTRLYPTNSPTIRTDFALAYDPVREVTVFFGGRDGGQSPYGDTWTWDGNNWTPLFPLHRPPPRWGAEMAFDSARGVMVLFGGSSSASSHFSDTWEWDGFDWILRSPADSPPARLSHGLAYDAARGVTVLFGGTGPVLMNDTWEWDGTNWAQVLTAFAPTPRAVGHGMEYDVARRAVVLFNGSVLTDETWEYRSPNGHPTVDAGGPYTVTEGGSVDVIASGSDPENGPLSYAWDLDNDGTFETPGQHVVFPAVGLSAPSTHTISVRIIDDGGLSAIDATTVSVGYNFNGFFPPVDNFPTWNELKSAGRGISVRFSLNGYKGLNIIEAGYPKSQGIQCNATYPVDGIEETVTAGASSLSYDAGTDQYIYIWKTDKVWANSCRQLVIKFNDGKVQRANFHFLK